MSVARSSIRYHSASRRKTVYRDLARSRPDDRQRIRRCSLRLPQFEPLAKSQLVTRTAYTQLRYSPILLLICMLIMSIAFIIPLIAILQDGSMMLMGLATFFIQIICYFPILKYYSMNTLYALSLSFIGILYMLFTLNSSYHYYFNKGALWKKRYYKN